MDRPDPRPFTPETDDDDLLPVSVVAAKTSLSRATIYRLVEADKFPKPRQITEARVGWRRGDVREWCAARPIAQGVSSGVHSSAA